jgi:rare lipoprotein A
MNSTSFRSAQRRVPKSFRRFAAGVLVLGLALSASAKDDSPSGKTDVLSAKPIADGAVATRSNLKKRSWLQVGVASWYGSQFQGRKTAAGEPFDMNSMTCAHPTLPMGTWLRVTNLKNRRTTFVRVNDRGPVLEGRIVDLSFAAARAVGLVGVGKVKLETVRDGDPELAQALVAQLQVPMLGPLGR